MRTHALHQNLRVAAFFLFAFFISSVIVADELPPGVRDTQNPSDVSLTPEEALARIKLPDGFRVTLFAGEPDIRRPIAFDIDDRGRLWVVENYSHPNWKAGEGNDRIVILEDSDNDGRFDKRKIFYDKGNYFSAIAIGHGGVWIGNAPELLFIPDRNGDDIPDGKPIVKLDGFQRASAANVVNNFHWGPDGWFYGAQGQPKKGFIGPPGASKKERVMMTRGIWRYHPYDGRFEVIARGMVNPWGADFNEYGDLITVNTVLAHLWHIVPGMYCQRRGHERDNPFVYERIQSIADHLHWSGGKWQDSRVTDAQHHVAGGGHAHCGAMIYLGDNWPKQYRGQLFTGNLHGNRLNNEKLVPNGSTYVGVHQPDFLFANDPWFRSMTQKYGPDGGVYVSDWHDFGECHDKDGSHRSSGRIYKVVYKSAPQKPIDLGALSPAQLAKLHLDNNEWLVRHARRILHERFEAGEDVKSAVDALRAQFREQKNAVVLRLRALWSLALIGELPATTLLEIANDPEPHVRKWVAKLIADRAEWHEEASIETINNAANDENATVRLVAACALQKLPNEQRWPVARTLLSRPEDDDDPYLPLMTWYGIEPAITDNVEDALEMASTSKVPKVSRFIARKVTELRLRPLDEMIAYARVLSDTTATKAAVLNGIADAVENRRVDRAPQEWPALQNSLRDSENPELRSLANRLAIAFGDKQAITTLQRRIADVELEVGQRISAIQTLRELPNALPLKLLHQLVDDAKPAIRGQALQELALRGNASTSQLLLSRVKEFSSENQRLAVSVFAARLDSSKQLLSAMDEGQISRSLVSAYDLQKLRLHRDPDIKAQLARMWPANTKTHRKAESIQRYKKLLNKTYLATGDASRGRKLFDATCAKCHQLFGEGSTLAPELTGSGRANLDYVLSNLIDPSGIVDPAYRLTTALTDEGRVITGFIIEQTETSVRMRTQQGDIDLSLADVEVLETSSKSMMPEGLLEQYTDEEVRDLVVYLASAEQVLLPTP